MSRFGALTAKFYAPSDLSTVLNVGAVTTKQPVSGVTDDYRDGEGASSLTFINDTDLNTLAAVGNICWSYKTDSVRDDLGADGVTFTEPFIIRSRVAGPEPDQLTISGPDLLTELKRFTVFRPLGDETITNTTLAAQGDAPITGRTLAAGAPGGVDNVIPSTTSAGDEGKEIEIELDDGGTHLTIIMSVQDVGGTDHYILRDRMPSNAALGNDITLRTRQLRVTAPETFQQGVEVVVTLNVGSHTTLIAESPTDTNLITLRDALPSLANNGNAIQSKDYSGKSTTDVTDVVTGFATGWTVSFEAGTGTEDGTRYAGGGDTVYDILRSISDETGEIFRLRSAEAAPMGPKRVVVWRRTHDAAGVAGTVRLVMPTQANMASETANKNRAILLERPRHAGEYDPVTQIIPVAGDARVTLHACSAAAVSAAAALGFDVVYPTSLYASPYLENTALTASIGIHQRRVIYSEVSVEGDNSGSIQEAADKLLKLSISYLRSHVTTAKEIEAVCVSPIGIRPAQKVELYFQSPTGEYTIDYTVAPLYVQAVRREVSSRGDMPGVPITILSLSPDPTRPPSHSGLRPTPIYTDSPRPGPDTTHPKLTVGGPGKEIGRRLKAIERMAANMGTPMLVSLAVGGGGGGGGGGVTDHGMLTGLADNDHTQYVNAATNTSLVLAGQGLAVNLKTDPGLVISSGLGMGTPSTLTAATTNAVSGSNHSHDITTTSNAKSTVSTILQGDANGDVTLRYLVSDKVTTPEVDTASGDLTLDPNSGKTINDGNLEFTGARSVTTSSGSLTLAPVSDLIFDPASDATKLAASSSLQTANWSSGFLGTGWGVTYAGAADFRSIYADELHVAAFIADTARVKVGSEYITPSMAIISRNFTIPAVSGTGTLYVEDAPGLDDTAIFADNDWILLRIIDRPAGGLNVLNVWGQVSGYSNLTEGEQSWTFTTRSAGAAAINEAARRGGVALDFGKSGDSWLWLTSIDPAGSPYLGITTWAGSDPYTEINRSHKLRLGQLMGTSGLFEWGLQAGQNTSNFIRFSDLRSEIHGSRLSLYAGDGAQLRARAVRVEHYRNVSDISYLLPNADHTSQGVLSTGATFYTEVDESPASPTTTDYIYNGTNQSGVVFMGLANPTWTGSTYRVDIHVNIETTGFTNDTIVLYGQIFDADEMTPLTSEKLIYTATTNTTTTPKVQCDTVESSASQTRWNAARLRLRWEYTINASEEAIRLDPNVPSIAVGNPLPTGTSAGGPGLWAGLESGAYKFKMGGTSGTGARVEWDGTDLILRNYDGTSMIRFDSDGTSYFAGAMTLGASGGIYQGTGTFASPTAGIKVWNSGGDGRYSTFSGGGEKVRINKDGVQLLADTVGFTRPSSVTWSDSIGGTAFASISANSTNTDTDASRPDSSKSSLVFIKNGTEARAILAGGTAYFTLDSAASYALLQNVDLYVKEKGVAVGYTATPSLNRGQITSDLAGEHNFNSIVLQDTTDIAHGMTTIVGTGTYATLGKVTDGTTGGGLEIGGYTEATIAFQALAYGTLTNTTANGSGFGAFTLDAYLKSGTGGGAYGASDNLFVVRNNGTARFLIQGDGDFFYDGTGAAYDDKPDISLLRTLSREMWGGTIQSVWDKFITTNRQHLIDAGVLSEGGFINGPALNRLLTGSIWQLHERLCRLEAANSG